MTDQYNKCNQMMLEGMTDATSLQALGCGSTLCSLQGGKITPFGQEVVPASPLVQQVDKKVKQTIGTYGLNGSASLKSASLQQSLENKLQALLPTGGLTMFIKGWKRKTTPSGRLYCQLAVSVRPTNAIDCGLWATPNTMDHLPQRSEEAAKRQFSTTRKGRTAPANLREQVNPGSYPQTLWATPSVRDHKDTPGMKKEAINKDGTKRNRMDQLGRQVFGSTAQTGNKGSLNPQFPCWLMGIPNEWELSIVQGMQSYRKSPQTSYKPVYSEEE